MRGCGLYKFAAWHQCRAVVHFFLAKMVRDFLSKMTQNKSTYGAFEPILCVCGFLRLKSVATGYGMMTWRTRSWRGLVIALVKG